MIVNPAPGALVRDPATSLAVENGAEVDPNEPYWARLLADGDVVEVDGAAEPAPANTLPALIADEPLHTDEDAA